MSVAPKLGVLALLGLVALLVVVVTSNWIDGHTRATALAAPSPTPELIARGAYLAKLGDCAACHSVSGRPAFSGGLRMGLPIGAIYTTNITPDPRYGIGKFTLADFDRAVRFGVSGDHSLYPAMPFASYAGTRPEDVVALYTYFKYGVPPAAFPSPANDIIFPLSMRWPLTFWRLAFAPKAVPDQAPKLTDNSIARGAYFVEGLGHCGECHTPRGVALQLKAINPRQGALFLSGAPIEGYFAPSLRSGGNGTLADWSVEELATFLTTGANDKSIAFASMSDVITHSTQYLSKDDALDTARYLKSLANTTSTSFRYDDATRLALRNGNVGARGAQIYLDNCAACHRPDGKGYDRVFPALAGNPVVQASNPASLVSIVMNGSTTPTTPGALAKFTMPSFAWRLSDQDVASVVSFIRASWGNNTGPVEPPLVEKSRQSISAAKSQSAPGRQAP